MSYQDLTIRIKKNFKILGAAKIAGGILSAATILLIGRFLGVEKFGIFSMIISIVEICNIILSLRIWDTAIKFIGEDQNNKNRVSKFLSLSIILNIISSAFSFLCIFLIANNFSDKFFDESISSKNLIISYSLVVLFISINETFDGILRTFNQYKAIFKINIYTNMFRLSIICIALLKFNFNIQNIIYCFVLSYLLSFTIRLVYFSKTLIENNIPLNFTNLPNSKDSIRFIKFMLNAHFSNILNIANDKNLGVLAVGYLANPFYAGLYRAARAIVKIIRRLMDPVLEIIFPELVKLYSEKNFETYKKIIFDTTKIIFFVSLGIGLIIFLFSETLVILFFGNDYLESILSLKILIFAMIIHNLAYWVNPSILSSGKPKFLTLTTLITTFAYCISLPYLIHEMNHNGAAISLLIKNILTLSLGIIFFQKFLRNKT
tara:strand:- start:11467 stop:12765 length:1299 start_codon:yes stop_codon:yes gene_type:complete